MQRETGEVMMVDRERGCCGADSPVHLLCVVLAHPGLHIRIRLSCYGL